MGSGMVAGAHVEQTLRLGMQPNTHMSSRYHALAQRVLVLVAHLVLENYINHILKPYLTIF